MFDEKANVFICVEDTYVPAMNAILKKGDTIKLPTELLLLKALLRDEMYELDDYDDEEYFV